MRYQKKKKKRGIRITKTSISFIFGYPLGGRCESHYQVRQEGQKKKRFKRNDKERERERERERECETCAKVGNRESVDWPVKKKGAEGRKLGNETPAVP